MQPTTLEIAINELRTFRDLVRWGASEFNAAQLCFGHGNDNAWDEALCLARHVLHLSPEEDGKIADVRLLSTERRQIAELFQQRIQQRKPAAYLTHQAWFAGLSFYVDERVIIPRSPMAELIAQGFTPWLDEISVDQVLDLCTGSGCIAIACAMAFPQAHVDAVDISGDALAVAEKNVAHYELQDSISLLESNLFTQLPKKRYDLIISNPPYVNAVDMAQLPQEYQHEPRLALAAGDDGLDAVRVILAQAPDYLSEHGILVIEVGRSAPALEACFPDLPFLWLDLKQGGQGVFLLTAKQLLRF
jgi:ribosomal protein L3 glutamine methyltransferase